MAYSALPDHIAVQADELGKRYRIGAVMEGNNTLRDSVSALFRRQIEMVRGLGGGQRTSRPSYSDFWALRDVSFQVARGEVLGVIGRNGAGKSTLLKIVSRITPPDEGIVRVRGRVGSLLEVGTGFHFELTGRENIFLSGAVLGMRRSEIERNFDQIVAFAGVEKFIDTPVKHYSNGMYLRLAFSVAAHLEPEILVVDEVLAVGDVEFQQKCLGKMSDVASEGRTVLFVSHDMNAIRQLCHTALWLERSAVKQYGPVSEVVHAYLSNTTLDRTDDVFPVTNQQYGISIQSLSLRLEPGVQSDARDLHLDMAVHCDQPLPRIGIGFGLLTSFGARVSWLDDQLTNYIFDMQAGDNHFSIDCPAIDRVLASGEYVISLWLNMPAVGMLIELDRAAAIQIPGLDQFGTGRYLEVAKHGPVVLPLSIRRAEPSPQP